MHFLNIRIAKKPDTKFEYTFRLVSLYLVQPTEELEILIPSEKKHGLNEWMILPLKIKNTHKVVNLLEWPTTSHASQNATRIESLRRRNKGPEKEINGWKGGKKISK